jgi:uncharacterized membrane protein
MAIQLPAAAMRTMVIASAIGVPALGVLAWPSPAHADFTVCNKTSRELTVAVGYIQNPTPSDLSFVTEGWYTLRAGGQCKKLVLSSETSDPHNYFYYAHGGGLRWEGDVALCTTQQPFTIVRSDDENACAHNGGQIQNFVHVPSTSGNLRQSLGDGSQPFDEG